MVAPSRSKPHRSRRRASLAAFAALGLVFAVASPAVAQQMGHEDTVANPTPPPAPPAEKPEDDDPGVSVYRKVAPESDKPWGLDAQLLAELSAAAETYYDYAQRFTCDESARLAEYEADGDVKERERQYAYLLVRDDRGRAVREFRQRLDRSGNARAGAVEDEDPFPPAYAWVFLFSEFHRPYFSFRYLDNRFDGFDWVHEIQFKGSYPFTDGQDIRQWEGTVLVDAVTLTPVQVRAEPAGQQDRIEALYRQYVSSFNILGMRTKPKPFGYRGEIQFRYRSNELSFPTTLRYDTFQAISTTQIVPVRATIRDYSDYRFYGVETQQETGDVVGGEP